MQNFLFLTLNNALQAVTSDELRAALMQLESDEFLKVSHCEAESPQVL
jgi:hypothetical protein